MSISYVQYMNLKGGKLFFFPVLHLFLVISILLKSACVAVELVYRVRGSVKMGLTRP